MRFLVKVQMPVEKFNAAVLDGSADRKIKAALEAMKPDAAYFYEEDGERTGIIVVNFDKASQIDPANGDAWSGVAFTAFRTSRPDVTLHALTMRSRTLPENPATLFLWAQAYDTLHQKQQAVVYYRRFIEAAAGKMPDQEWQARQRLQILAK